MTLPMTTESYARVSRDLITTLICLLAAALIISALARTPETSNTQDPPGDRIRPKANYTDCPQKGGGKLGADVLNCLHHLVAKRSLPWVLRIEICELAEIAIDGIRLGECLTIHFEHWQSAERRVGLNPSATAVGQTAPKTGGSPRTKVAA